MSSNLLLDKNGIWVDNDNATVSYPSDGNDLSFAIENNSFWFNHRNQVLKTIIKRYSFDKNYADIGGGNGFQAKFITDNFPLAKVFLIEPGYGGCLNAKKRGLEHVYNILFQKFDFILNDVTAVGLYDVVEHIENDSVFLNDLKQKLPAGSLIYVTVPAHNYLWSDVDDFGGHFRRYNMEMLKKLAKNSDLKLIYSSYFFSYIPPLTFFLRSLLYRIRGNRKKQNILTTETEQHNPSSFVLKIFDIFHRYELKTMLRSSVPVGASCIAVFKT
jgi:hypothetical protein